MSRVRNICFFSPLVPSKWEKKNFFAQLVLLSLYIFWGKCVSIFQAQFITAPFWPVHCVRKCANICTFKTTFICFVLAHWPRFFCKIKWINLELRYVTTYTHYTVHNIGQNSLHSLSETSGSCELSCSKSSNQIFEGKNKGNI